MHLTSLAPYDLSSSEARRPLIAATIMCALATITTIMRYSARLMQGVGIHRDDYLIVLGHLSGYVELGLYWAFVIHGGVGRHMKDVGLPDVLLTLKLIVPFTILYNVSMAAIKCSIITFYLRIFGINPLIRKTGYAIIAFELAWGIGSIIWIFVICTPFSYSWNTSQAGTCGDRDAMYITNGAMNMFVDILCLSLPIPAVIKLQLPLAQKVLLLLIFGLGIFVTGISVIRLHTLTTIDFDDITYSVVGGVVWTCLEESIAIINANLPILRPFMRAIAPKFFKTSRSRGTADKTEDGTADGKLPLVLVAPRYLELNDIGPHKASNFSSSDLHGSS